MFHVKHFFTFLCETLLLFLMRKPLFFVQFASLDVSRETLLSFSVQIISIF